MRERTASNQDATMDFVRLVLADLSPDVTGEMLRELTFVGEGFGCYHNFDVRGDAVPWNRNSRRVFWQLFGGFPSDEAAETARDVAEMGEGYTFKVASGVVVHVCWYWDGDGCLAFHVRGPGFDRILQNTDCKKDYGWREVER